MTGPDCNSIQQFCSLCMDGKWCDHLTEYVKQGKDAGDLDFGIEFDIPLVIKWNMWTKVRISSESIADICAPLILLVDDLFTNDTEEHDLGLWSKGEGMWSIRSVCFDWMKARAGIELLSDIAPCKSTAHNPFKHDRLVANLQGEGLMWHNWIVACYGLCLPEYNEVSGVRGSLVPNAGSAPDPATMNRVRNGR